MNTPGLLMRRRVLRILLIFAGSAMLLCARLVWLQVVRGDELTAKAAGVRTRVVPIPSPRGKIMDATGQVLAVSVGVDSVYAVPAQVVNAAAAAQKVAPILGLSVETVQKKLTRRVLLVWIQRRVTAAQATAVRQADLPGIYLVQEASRLYPEGLFAGQIVGFSGLDNVGLAGVELSYNKYLKGTNGRIVVETDARNQEIPSGTRTYVPPVPGDTVQLTINGQLQKMVQVDLDQAVAQAHALGGYALMMNPTTGAILAMAAWPTYDPNYYAQADPSLWTNPLITFAFSPGSVFKPITAAAALATGVVTPSTPFYDTGSIRLPGATIHNFNHAGLGATTFAIGFQESVNTIFARVGVMLGADRFYTYLQKFGFLGRTGIDLPGESAQPNIVRPEKKATPLDIAEEAFGQTLAVTPISMVTAIAAIANGGVLMWPHVGAAIYTPSGQLVQAIAPRVVDRVLSPAVAYEVQTLMGSVVSGGTGKNAAIPCYSIAGKTGTTQKYVGGRVGQDVYIGSFAGYAPVHGAKVALYVMIDEPQGMYYGGQVAAPVFREIMSQALPVLGVQPACPPGQTPPGQAGDTSVEVSMPSLVGMTVAQAEQAAASAGLYLQVSGPGQTIQRQVPAPGDSVQKWSTVLGYTTTAASIPGSMVTVPDLRGMSVREAAQVLSAVDLGMDGEGTGNAIEQAPASGERVAPGSTVAVTFH